MINLSAKNKRAINYYFFPGVARLAAAPPPHRTQAILLISSKFKAGTTASGPRYATNYKKTWDIITILSKSIIPLEKLNYCRHRPMSC